MFMTQVTFSHFEQNLYKPPPACLHKTDRNNMSKTEWTASATKHFITSILER